MVVCYSMWTVLETNQLNGQVGSWQAVAPWELHWVASGGLASESPCNLPKDPQGLEFGTCEEEAFSEGRNVAREAAEGNELERAWRRKRAGEV